MEEVVFVLGLLVFMALVEGGDLVAKFLGMLMVLVLIALLVSILAP